MTTNAFILIGCLAQPDQKDEWVVGVYPDESSAEGELLRLTAQAPRLASVISRMARSWDSLYDRLEDEGIEDELRYATLDKWSARQINRINSAKLDPTDLTGIIKHSDSCTIHYKVVQITVTVPISAKRKSRKAKP